MHAPNPLSIAPADDGDEESVPLGSGRAPTSTIAAPPAPASSRPPPSFSPPPLRPIFTFLLGALAGMLLTLLVGATGGSQWGLHASGWAPGAPQDSLFGGPLSLSATPSPGTATPTPTASGTRTPTASLSPGASPSNTPSNSPTPSLSGTPSPTATATGTPTTTRTASGTPSGTPPPSASRTPGLPTMTVPQCVAVARAWLNASRFGDPVAYDTSITPYPLEVLGAALARNCPADVAEATRWAYTRSLVADDVCYLVVITGDAGVVKRTWGSAVPPERAWYVAPGSGDAGAGVLGVPAAAGRAWNNMLSLAMTHVAGLPGTGGCKWWVTASDHTWVNPRAALAAMRGVPHEWPVVLGYQWYLMGFIKNVAGASGGFALWSRAAWDAVVAPPCPLHEATLVKYCTPKCEWVQPPDDVTALFACSNRRGNINVNLNQIDASGALALNGVPLEPGPAPDVMAWLQQCHNRGGHWVGVDNLNSAFIAAFWDCFTGVYGPLGLLPPGAAVSDASGASATATPPPGSAGAVPLRPPVPLGAAAPACAVRATAALRALVELRRLSPTRAAPLPLDVAYETTAGACDPGAPAAAGDPPGGAGAPRANPNRDFCFFLSHHGQHYAAFYVVNDGWGWRWRERVFLFGPAEDPDLNMRALPGEPLNVNKRMVPGLRAMWIDPATAGCKWWLFASDWDYVNPRALGGMVRGLRSDVPQMLAFWMHGDAYPVTTPARGKTLFSRAAVEVLATRLGVDPLCPVSDGDADDSVSVARCAWATGVVPLHTYTLDVANLGILMDWALQQEHYLMGWGLIVDMGQNPWHPGADTFPFRQNLLEEYYSKLYGDFWNISAVTYYRADGSRADPPGMDGAGRRRAEWAAGEDWAAEWAAGEGVSEEGAGAAREGDAAAWGATAEAWLRARDAAPATHEELERRWLGPR